jgi:hypothetical protein
MSAHFFWFFFYKNKFLLPFYGLHGDESTHSKYQHFIGRRRGGGKGQVVIKNRRK